jgi:hypothetical protein
MLSTLRHLRGKPRSQNQKSGPDALVQRLRALREDRHRYRRAFFGERRGKSIPLGRHGMLHQVVGSLRHPQPKVIDGG